MKFLLCVLFASLWLVPCNGFAQGGSAIGSLPSTTTTAPPNASHPVNPGESHTNGDGVTQTCDASSPGVIKINPKVGTGTDIHTTVTYKTGAIGETVGIDSSDTVNVGAKAKAKISGTGGTINLTGSAKVEVNNTAPPGGDSIFLNIPTGGTIPVPPGGHYP